MKVIHNINDIHGVLYCPVCGGNLIQFKKFPSEATDISREYADALVSAGMQRIDAPCGITCLKRSGEKVKELDPEESNLMKLGLETGDKKKLALAAKMCRDRKE